MREQFALWERKLFTQCRGGGRWRSGDQMAISSAEPKPELKRTHQIQTVS